MRTRFGVALSAILSAALHICICPAPARGAPIWVEGEDATRSAVTRHPWWYDKVKADALSGGAWISNWSGEKEGTAEYEIDVAEGGSYTLWVRANPLATKISYRIDGGGWTPIDMKQGQRGRMNIAADNKPDLRFIAWAKVGKVGLSAGSHVIQFKMHSDNSNHGGLDCFCLDDGSFVPSGIMKPGAGAMKSRAVGPDKAIWIEGEDASRNTMNRHPWWYDKVKSDALSGGAWMSNYSDDKAGAADYEFEAVVADDYAFWVRANPLRSEIRYKLDSGEWRRIDLEKGQRGRVNIAADNKPDMRFIAWAKVGKVRLAKGPHTISFRMSGPLHNHGGSTASASRGYRSCRRGS
ncbi:MAG: hypothetical protein ACYTKD_08445 [Planctomycetota bacterium]|jgi:hypothetical protein